MNKTPVLRIEDIRTQIQIDKNPRHIREPFFLGPVCLTWLQLAGQLPGKSLHLAIAAAHQSRLSGSSIIHVRPKIFRDFGVSRHDRYHAMPGMVEMGLLEVLEQRRGKAPTVRLLNHIPKGARGFGK